MFGRTILALCAVAALGFDFAPSPASARPLYGRGVHNSRVDGGRFGVFPSNARLRGTYRSYPDAYGGWRGAGWRGEAYGALEYRPPAGYLNYPYYGVGGYATYVYGYPSYCGNACDGCYLAEPLAWDP